MSKRSRAALAIAAVTATIPAVAAVGPVDAVGAATHHQARASWHLTGHFTRAALGARRRPRSW